MYVLHKIEVAQAFDELSILEIKELQSTNQDQKNFLKSRILILVGEINQSIGNGLAEKIYYSDFYKSLFASNLDIFKSVDKFKKTEPAQLNMKRIDAKRKLQKYFFGNSLDEIKI